MEGRRKENQRGTGFGSAGAASIWIKATPLIFWDSELTRIPWGSHKSIPEVLDSWLIAGRELDHPLLCFSSGSFPFNQVREGKEQHSLGVGAEQDWEAGGKLG